ncbi:MAG: hypothetical protein JO366_18485 [Methylobacteriaceae bacterium]|nr:hypothetical protein [Methylobacteriaceae bacterium]MBV9702579.1 hypothetical protein [Methylobacteriaceae bacterium]
MIVRNQPVKPEHEAPERPQEQQVEPPAEYSPPKLVSLGKTRKLILGYWDEGWADYGAHYKHAGE